jgi:hypothetical protein
MAARSKFQFRTRDLFWAVSLIGAALGLGLSELRRLFAGDQVAVLAALVLSACGVLASVGAGIGGLLSAWFAKIDREDRHSRRDDSSRGDQQ